MHCTLPSLLYRTPTHILLAPCIPCPRRFFSTLLLRPAKMNKALGSGSMSLVPLLPGRCATGVKAAVNLDMGKYQTLSEEQKAKIKAALEKKVCWGVGCAARWRAGRGMCMLGLLVSSPCPHMPAHMWFRSEKTRHGRSHTYYRMPNVCC
jgi:hypothetical protein